MRGRAVLLLLVLLVVALTGPESEPVRIIQPRWQTVIAGPGGVDLPFQARVERHADNRAVRLEWYHDGIRAGSSAKTLDGEEEAAIYPLTPIYVRAHAGTWLFVASLYSGSGIRGQAVFEVQVQ